MSRSCELTVEITGRSVHLARFAEGCDALDAAARLLTRLYALAEGKPCLLRFGKMESGSARNAVSDHTHLEARCAAWDDGCMPRSGSRHRPSAGPSARRRAAP